MAQKILRQFQIAGLAINQTGSRMAEATEARRSLRPWDIQPVGNWVEHVLSKNILIEEIPIQFAENKIFLLVVQRPSFVVYQNFAEYCPIRNNPGASDRFGCDNLSAPEVLLNLDHPGIEVYVLPLQRKQLSQPQAGQRDTGEQAAIVRRCIFQNQLELISCPRRFFKSLTVRPVAFSDWRSLNQIIVQRDIENSLEDDQDIPNGLRRKLLDLLLPYEIFNVQRRNA